MNASLAVATHFLPFGERWFMRTLGVAGILSLLILSGCGSAAPPTQTSSPGTGTGQVGTPIPSAVPLPTAPPRPLTADQVMAKLKAAGLPIGQVFVYTEVTDPNKLLGRPGQYTSKTDAGDTRHPELDPTKTCVVCVEVYPTPAGAQARKAEVDRIGASAAFLLEYTYAEGTVCLRQDHALLPSESAAYDAALKQIVAGG